MARERFKMAAISPTSILLITACFVAVAFCAKSKSMFRFTRPLYVATMPENARGRVYAVPVQGRMGVNLPWSGIIAQPPRFGGISSENVTAHQWHKEQQAHHQSLVRFRIISSDKHNFFKAESEVVGDFAYLRIRIRSSLDVDLNRELTPEFSLRVKAIYRRQAAGFGGSGRNLETRTEVLLKITDQNDLSPVFLPEHYQAKIDQRTPMFSSVTRVTASDGDIGLNGEVYYQLMNQTEYFAVHPTSGVISLIRTLTRNSPALKHFNLSIAAVDRASRLFSDSRSRQGMANLARVDVEITEAETSSKKSAWTVKTTGNEKFSNCGLVPDGLCATLALMDSRLSVRHLEIGDSTDGDDSARFFYLHRSKPRRGEEDFEIRSIAAAPAGSYNLTLHPLDLNLLFNVSSSGTFDGLCDDKDLDIWMDRMEFSFGIPEWAPDGFLVGDFHLDPKAGDTKFELRKMDDETEKTLPFWVTPQTGILYLKLRKNETASLNYKRRSVYEFFVHVRRTNCRPEKEEKRKVIVRVKDCNDHAPRFIDNCDRLIFYLNRLPSSDSVLCKFATNDDDIGENGRVSFELSLNPTSISRFFKIDYDRGELTFKNSSAFPWNLQEGDKKSGESYSLVVRAVDHGWPLKRITEKTVVVNFNESGSSHGSSDRWSVENGDSKQRELVQENRHPPAVASEWSFEIEESAPNGRRVGSVQASDLDGGYAGVLLYTIEKDQSDPTMNTKRPFDIDLYNGTISVFRRLDREKRDTYAFRVSIRDLGTPSRHVSTKVVVKVLDVNDNAPRFEKPIYRVRVKENAEIGASVLQLRAFDDDSEGSGRLRYSLVTRTPYFNLDPQSGILSLKAELDRERIERHRLIVQAQDYGQPPLSALVNVTIIVQDVNDNAPVCRTKALKTFVPEDYPAGALVTCVDGDDPDTGENGRISYRLVDWSRRPINASSDVPFVVDSETGCIRLAWTIQASSKQRKSTPPYLELILDYERQPFYNLTVELSDFGSPRLLKNTCNVFVEVMDVNENRYAPKFISYGEFGNEDEEPMFAIEAEIYENEAAPTFVKQLKAIDPDASANALEPKVIYSIVDGDGLGVFTIDQEGRIHANRSLDRESKPFYWLVITATDRAPVPLSSSVDVFIRILDRNDNPPTPSKSIYYASVIENSSPNLVILRVEGTDADFLTTPILQLDGEEDDERDQETDLKPVPQDFAEASAPLTYKITGGDPQSFFKIDSRTGDISTDRRMLDREATPELELEVTISDNGEPESLISTVTVVVRVEDENDHAPEFPSKMMNYDTPERSKRRGKKRGMNTQNSFLCRVFAHDEDEGKNAEIRYSITEGNEQGIMRIDQETGSIFAMENATWNDSQTFILTIRATDNGVPSKYSERHLHLSVVSDGPNAKSVDPKSLKIVSNLVANPLHISALDPIGHRVGLLEAVLEGADDGRRIWFYLLDGNADNAFALRPDTGVLLLAKRPTLSSYTLTFLATVDGIVGVEGQAKVIVQPILEDERPQFLQDPIQIRVPENESVDTILLRLPEHLKSNYDREEIRFFLSESYYVHNNSLGGVGNDGIFQLDAKSGIVYLIQALDREHQARYLFKVGARSRRGKVGYSIVEVQVVDINDHAPEFINRHVQLRMSQMTNPGTVIYQMAAFDGDEGTNGRLTFLLTMGNYKDAFAIDQQTGALRLLRSLTKADLTTEFVLTVKVEDGGRPPLFDTATVRILLIPSSVGGENGQTTGVVHFTHDVYAFRASEKLPVGGLIGHVQADGGGAVEYAVLEDLGGYFDIHPLTGAVTLRRLFDFEHSRHAEATIRAWIPSNVPATAEGTARLVVTLIDGNDHAPVFKKLYYEANVEENSPVGTVVTIVEATDSDTGQGGVVTYHIVEEWARQYFEIDFRTGAIRLAQLLDYEREGQQRFEFSVSAEDLGEPIMYSVRPALVEIKVLDVNDVAPAFDAKAYDFVIHTSAAPGMKIGRLEAEDADTVGTIQYHMQKSLPCRQLDIDRNSGILRLSRLWINLKAEETISCQAIATDGLHDTTTAVNVKVVPYARALSGFRFEQSRYEVVILENASDVVDGAILAWLRTVGAEPFEAISFKLLNSDEDQGKNAVDSYIALNPTTGALLATVNTKKVDREVTPTLFHLAEAKLVRRPEIPAAQALVIVRVLDVNDNKPRFVGLPYAISVSLKTQWNQSVFRVVAMDSDEGMNGIVKYSWAKNQQSSSFFRIDEYSGEVYVSGDLEQMAKIIGKNASLVVVANDSGSPSLSSTAVIAVRLVSATTPIFPKASYNVSVHEGPSSVGTVLFEKDTFGVTSATGAVLGYSFLDTEETALDATFFDLDFTTGRMILRKPFDRNRKSLIKLPIRVKDYAVSENLKEVQSWSDAVVEVHVLDYNDNAPVFERPLYVMNVSENASLSGNTVLATFKATDEDKGSNSRVTYSLRSTSDKSETCFRLNPETGVLTLAKRLNYEKQKKHVLTVVAEDFGVPSLSGTAAVHIHVLDANDNPPAFTQMAFEVEMPSPKWPAGQFVGQALASDPDEFDVGRLRYSIFSGNDGDWLTIDERSGVLRTARASTIDGKILPSAEYSLILTVTDGVHSASCRFLIKIRHGTAAGMSKFSKNVYHARVKERSTPGTFVTEIRVEDKPVGAIPTLRYRLVGSSLFRMEETTGKVFTTRQLDATTRPVHHLTVLAEKWSDFTMVAHCRLQIAVINENNRPPKFLADRFFATITTETKPNTIILKIRAMDLDRDDVLEYSTDSKSSGNFDDYFFLDSNTGALAVRRNLESVVGTIFKTVARVTDRGNPPQRTTAPLEIRVVSEATADAAQCVGFARLEYIYTVREDVRIGTDIGQLDMLRRGASTAGGNQNFRLSIITPRLAASGIDWVGLGERTGSLRIVEKLDRETTSELQFYVSSSKGSSKEMTSMALVRILIEDADDNGPVFENVPTNEPIVVAVAEDTPVGGVVTVFSATDPDSGEAGRVTYWIDEADYGDLPFKIDSATGWLTTKTELDRESQDTYNFIIVAGSLRVAELRATLNITVKVTDANDQKPIFQKSEYEFVFENGLSTMPGYVIGRVMAVDADLPPNNEVHYFLIGGNERGLFDIWPTGEIYLARKVGPGDQSSAYLLKVLASDGSFEDTATANITIPKKFIPVCSSAPILCQPSRSITVNEDEPIGKVVDRLPKLPTGLNYRLVSGSDAANFDFTIKNTGEVAIFRSLDYERRRTYTAVVEVTSAEGDSNGCWAMQCMVRLEISVQDVNDCAPEFDSEGIPNELSVLENYNGSFPYFLGRLHASDADSGLNGLVRYHLSLEVNEDEDKDILTIDPAGGALFLWRPLDRERRELYNLTVFAVDGGKPKPMAAQKSILVKVLDVNDNPPTFVQKSYDVSAPEDTPVGVVLARVEAISADSGENAIVAYKLEKSANSDMFEIDEKTGDIRLRQPLDYEKANEHSIIVTATDGGKPPLSSFVQFQLRVVDVNDNEPVFEKRHYTVQIPENAAIRSRIVRVVASDLDSGKNGLLGYRIEPANRFFQIMADQQEPGWIILADALDYEKATRHEFQVMAYDHGQPSKSAVAVVTVGVSDVNDNRPKILNCNRTLTVKAHLPTSAPLLLLQTTDADGPSNGKPFNYTIVQPPAEGKPMGLNTNDDLFKVDSHGSLYALRTPLELPEYFVQISVRDSGEPPMSSQCRLHIRVAEESRFPPRLINTSFLVLSYMGEMGSGGVIGRVAATDDDPKDSVQYLLANVSRATVDAEGSHTEVDMKLLEGQEIFSIDPDDGRISAAAELQQGEYLLNVSASDGRFETFGAVTVSIRFIMTKMLDSAISIRISDRYLEDDTDPGRHRRRNEPFDERVFVERHLKPLIRAVASAVNARSTRFVHVLSVQKAMESGDDEGTGKTTANRRTGRGIRTYRLRRDRDGRTTSSGVDVLISIQKSRHQDYFKPEYVRKTLEQKLEDVERGAGVKIVSLVTETCRPDRCKNGGVCRERLHLYEMINNAILTETYSFVSPTHKRWAECVCADGYGGQQCEAEVNECAKKPCPVGRVCVATSGPHQRNVDQKAGYRCVCTGIGCPGYDSVRLMSPRGWIRYTLSENLETEMRFAITFRTIARSGVLLYSGGKTDFQSLELFGGQLRYRYDLGDGETLVYVDGRPSVDDGQWHIVRLERKGRTVKLTLDNRQSQVTTALGDAFVLNLHGADTYVGFGEPTNAGFVGCLKDATLNDDILPWHGPGVQLYDADVGMCTDDEFKRTMAAAAGIENVCGWCLNNGTCIRGESTSDTAWSCSCLPPFTGMRCETLTTKHSATGACASSPCRNGGSCVLDKSSATEFRCHCSRGYVGRTCSSLGNDPCGSAPCANAGACVKVTKAAGGADFFCNCTSAWTGQYCRQPAVPSPNIVGGLLGITVPELVGIIAIFLVLILLTVVIVLLCRRQRSFKRKKFLQRRGPLSAANKHGESEPMFSESDVTPSTFAQRQFGQNMWVSGGPCGAMVVVSDPNSCATPMSPAAMSTPGSFGNGSNGPPPLPPRSRGFQPHRGSKLSNLESALSTGIPTVQVRPLSMSERQTTPVDGGLARAAAGGYLETAANYGSAAEELERLGRRSSPTLVDLDDWKAALNKMNADSLEKLKEAAGITDEYWQNDSASGPGAAADRSGGRPSSSGQNAASAVSIQCLPEEEKSSGTYQWDYTDWNNTLGHHAGGGPPAPGPYGTLSHLSAATDDDYGTGTLPRGVCRLEDTDSEYAGNESGNDDHDTEEKSDRELKSRLRGDEFTKELLALTKAFGRQKSGTSDSEEGSSSRPSLSTFKANGNGGHSYLDRYLPRSVEPPGSTASERKLLLDSVETTENSSAVPDQFSDDEDEEFTTPSAVFQSSLLDTSRISEIGGGGASSDGERSTDSVVLATAAKVGGIKRDNSTLIVCSISDDEDEAGHDSKVAEDGGTGNNNNRTFLKKPRKQTEV